MAKQQRGVGIIQRRTRTAIQEKKEEAHDPRKDFDSKPSRARSIHFTRVVSNNSWRTYLPDFFAAFLFSLTSLLF